MTDEQADKIVASVEALTRLIADVSRPPVIVTDDWDCEVVRNYERRGYPIIYQRKVERPKLNLHELFARPKEDAK